MSTLENNHNVYILGAGFSADRGLPTMKDFMLTMRDAHPWLADNGRKSEADAIEKVLAYRLKATSAGYRVSIELENIEDLFSLAAASRDDLTKDIRNAIAATLDYCLETKPAGNLHFGAAADGPFRKYQTTQQVNGRTLFSAPSYDYYVGSLIGMFSIGLVIAIPVVLTFFA